MLDSFPTWLSFPRSHIWRVKSWTRSESLSSGCALESSDGPLQVPAPGSTPESWIYLVWGLTLVLFFPSFNSPSNGESNAHEGLRPAGRDGQKVLLDL